MHMREHVSARARQAAPSRRACGCAHGHKHECSCGHLLQLARIHVANPSQLACISLRASMRPTSSSLYASACTHLCGQPLTKLAHLACIHYGSVTGASTQVAIKRIPQLCRSKASCKAAARVGEGRSRGSCQVCLNQCEM